MISFRELQRLQGIERDLVDVALVLARAATDNGRRTPLDAAIEALGFSREQLASVDDPA